MATTNKMTKKFMGLQDFRSSVGMFSRGKNIYNSASHAPNPMGKTGVTKAAMLRRIKK